MKFNSISYEFVKLKDIFSLSFMVLFMFIVFVFIVILSNKLFNVILNVNLSDAALR